MPRSMTSRPPQTDVVNLIRQRFADENIDIRAMDVRDYPDETIVVIRVDQSVFARASELANALDRDLASLGFDGFVTIKSDERSSVPQSPRGRVRNLSDPRVDSVVSLLTARSRTSEVQPSLTYQPDVEDNLATATTPRHHLIFGRRGAGKTALLVETKRIIEKQGHLSLWLNVQTYRHESAESAFLLFSQRLCELIQTYYRSTPDAPKVLATANALHEQAERFLSVKEPNLTDVRRVVPRIQALLRRFLDSSSTRIYIFIDDFHYLERRHQPLLLDLIHGCVRDCDAWIKVTAIEHLARWFDASQQLGLETGHDAAHIHLDLSLQNPARAKRFLESVLLSYATASGMSSLSSVFSNSSLDRLVLASGAVPRDYLTLSAAAIQQARTRAKSKQVGAQDVNKAAGDARQKKLDELQDDAASARDESAQILRALEKVRQFCLDEKSWTYFRIDFRDKEGHVDEYNRIQGLADLRLLHLIEASLSDEHRAGRRSEVYLLDLSQYAGHRLRRKLSVLDFEDGQFVLKKTGTSERPRVGDTANKRLSLLRRAPSFSLEELTSSMDTV